MKEKKKKKKNEKEKEEKKQKQTVRMWIWILAVQRKAGWIGRNIKQQIAKRERETERV